MENRKITVKIMACLYNFVEKGLLEHNIRVKGTGSVVFSQQVLSPRERRGSHVLANSVSEQMYHGFLYRM